MNALELEVAMRLNTATTRARYYWLRYTAATTLEERDRALRRVQCWAAAAHEAAVELVGHLARERGEEERIDLAAVAPLTPPEEWLLGHYAARKGVGGG